MGGPDQGPLTFHGRLADVGGQPRDSASDTPEAARAADLELLNVSEVLPPFAYRVIEAARA